MLNSLSSATSRCRPLASDDDDDDDDDAPSGPPPSSSLPLALCSLSRLSSSSPLLSAAAAAAVAVATAAAAAAAAAAATASPLDVVSGGDGRALPTRSYLSESPRTSLCTDVNEKSVPRPSVLCTRSAPPISCTSSRLMARPNPVPRGLSCWCCWPPTFFEKSRKSFSRAAAGMPMPLSSTRSSSSILCGGSGGPRASRAAGRATIRIVPPLGVNLMALVSRLSVTCHARAVNA